MSMNKRCRAPHIRGSLAFNKCPCRCNVVRSRIFSIPWRRNSSLKIDEFRVVHVVELRQQIAERVKAVELVDSRRLDKVGHRNLCPREDILMNVD
jgi:hypothetical protein